MKKNKIELFKEFSEFIRHEKALETFNKTIDFLEEYEQDHVEFVREQKKVPYSLTKEERADLVHKQELARNFKMVKDYIIKRREFFIEMFFKEYQ
tara:strand:- start:1806 stop:2090 length:285 start_codon:yes stop_codon:yes gene_type:complete